MLDIRSQQTTRTLEGRVVAIGGLERGVDVDALRHQIGAELLKLGLDGGGVRAHEATEGSDGYSAIR